eukprot:TRINITY_DN7602_c0_g1_i1.p3 TRINITY_DN7602_c0_g1~~TRINITY_DN7602_c0_g1_i1.p3  ORF type:complete len:182 (-),score=18.03 TRINITY_DN7602_c0_g1_i1:117-662(-)
MTHHSFPQPPALCSPTDCGVCRNGYAPDALITGAGACAKCLRHLHAIAADDDGTSSRSSAATFWPPRPAHNDVADLEAGWGPSAAAPPHSSEPHCCAPRLVTAVPVGGVWVADGEEPALQKRVTWSRLAGCGLLPLGVVSPLWRSFLVEHGPFAGPVALGRLGVDTGVGHDAVGSDAVAGM